MHSNGEKLEVEVKLRITERKQIERLKNLLKSKGAVGPIEVLEIDTYYTAPHRDFVKTEECLRVRINGSKTELTYKPATTSQMREARQFWKEEINVPVESEEVESVIKLLKNLDFKEIVTVKKRREIYRLEPSLSICVDEVDNCGTFVEIESSDTDPQRAHIMNLNIIKLLELQESQIVNVPYRDLVRK